MMTSNVELQRFQGETQEQHIARLRETLKARKANAQSELELKQHLDAALSAMRMSGAPLSARLEMQQQLSQTCIRLGVARGNVEIAENLLILALNAE